MVRKAGPPSLSFLNESVIQITVSEDGYAILKWK